MNDLATSGDDTMNNAAENSAFIGGIAILWLFALAPFFIPNGVVSHPDASATARSVLPWLFVFSGPITVVLMVVGGRMAIARTLSLDKIRERLLSCLALLLIFTPWCVLGLWQICYCFFYWGVFPRQGENLTISFTSSRFVWSNFIYPLISGFDDLVSLPAGLPVNNVWTIVVAIGCRVSSIILFSAVTLTAILGPAMRKRTPN